jgi:PAS domain-containing protein
MDREDGDIGRSAPFPTRCSPWLGTGCACGTCRVTLALRASWCGHRSQTDTKARWTFAYGVAHRRVASRRLSWKKTGMEHELSRALDALPGLVWTALPDRHIGLLDQRWCEYTGLSVDEGRCRACRAAIRGEDLTRAARALAIHSGFRRGVSLVPVPAQGRSVDPEPALATGSSETPPKGSLA